MAIKRLAGTVKINGVSYKVLRNKDELAYSRQSTPKVTPALSAGGKSGQSNMIEYTWNIAGGMGDVLESTRRNNYHWSMNTFMERDGEIVFLPSALYADEVSPGSNYQAYKPPVGVFELTPDTSRPEMLDTYWIQDCQIFKITGALNPKFYHGTPVAFSRECQPTDVTVFNNKAYIAMGSKIKRINISSVADNGSTQPRFATTSAHGLVAGDLIRIENSSHVSTTGLYNGIWVVDTASDTTHFDVNALTYSASNPDVPVTAVVYKITNRYMRTYDGTTLSKDDNSYKSITSVADSTVANSPGGPGGNRPTFTSAAHGYSAGDFVYIVNSTVSGYNSMSTSGVSTLYQIASVTNDTFTVDGIVYTATATAKVNRQDSDVFAEHFTVVGDLLVRGYQDSDGWKTSRVDIVNSNAKLDANWTAGIGTVSVGDANSPITDLVTTGEGEMVMKAEGAFLYRRTSGAYFNEIPELEEHRHARNGRGSFEWKGWVYIPTVVGLFRYRNGQTQNVTPGRGGIQDFTTPVGPIGWLTGDTERLFAGIEPFKINQQKNVKGDAPTRMYVDPTGVGAADAGADWTTDPVTNLSSFTAAGYFYIGSKQKWHRVTLDIDATSNTLASDTYSGLYLDAAEYWNGSAWTTRGNFVDFTRQRDSAYKADGTTLLRPSTLAASGVIRFVSDTPSDWATGGYVGGVQVNLPTGPTDSTAYYWTRFSLSAALSTDVKINRVTAAAHPEAVEFDFNGRDLELDCGGVQYILSMRDDGGKITWNTLWAWQDTETNVTDTVLSTVAGGAQPLGAMAIVQPQQLRSGETGTRWLFVGMHHKPYLCPLGQSGDPTEAGPYQQIAQATTRPFVVVLPDTDMGMPYETKSLHEINFDVSGISTTDIQLFYRVDGGAWTEVTGTVTLPYQFTAGSEHSGVQIGLAIVITPDDINTNVFMPRLTNLPSLRAYLRPEMSEVISLTLELEPEQMLPGQSDRRAAKTAYAALKTLETSAVSIPYVDVDQSTSNVYLMQLSKRVIHHSEDEPKVVADLVLSVI